VCAAAAVGVLLALEPAARAQTSGVFTLVGHEPRRDLATYLYDHNHHREHHARITAGRRPAELVYGVRKMEPE
jgi:hypothetical protein